MTVKSFKRPDGIDNMMAVVSSDTDWRVRQCQKCQTQTERHAIDRSVFADRIVMKV